MKLLIGDELAAIQKKNLPSQLVTKSLIIWQWNLVITKEKVSCHLIYWEGEERAQWLQE